MPVEPVSAGGISFATNVTPVTFNEPCTFVPDTSPSESLLFPSLEDGTASRRPAHSKKKPENHIPRPPNAFILFRSAFIKGQHVSTDVETNHSTLSKIIGLTWQNLPEDERQVWHGKAKAALDEHKRKFPQYAFRPLHSKGKGSDKRKVREVGPKDLKRCAKIAELLVEGKKGQELDAAIQEFDKTHIPEIITRFEAPLTANMYRRSSSIPPSDRDDSFLPETPCLSRRKPRSSSTRTSRQSTPSPAPSPQVPEDEPQDFVDVDDCPPLVANPYDDFYCLKQEPSFVSSLEASIRIFLTVRLAQDYNTFSFDNLDSPLTPFTCDSMTGDVNLQFNGLFTSVVDDPNRPALSIDTSSMHLDSWTRSSSPISAGSIPATPCYSDSPSYDAYPTFDDCASLSKSYDDLSSFPVYTNDCPSYVPDVFIHCPSDYTSASFQSTSCSETQSMCMGLDFSELMASIPTYQL